MILASALWVVTAYCSCSICTGRHHVHGQTKTGTYPVAGKTVACDPKYLGKRFEVEGFPRPLLCEDTGSKIRGRRVDIYWGRGEGVHEDALRFGRRRLKVKVLK